MTPRLRRVRARLVLGAGLTGLALTASLAAAPAASAQALPTAEAIPDAQPVGGSSRFDVGVDALLQALSRADSTPEGDLAGAPLDRGCVDAGPWKADVPRKIAEIFTCRVLEAGGSEEEARRVSAEAVTVAACESAFEKKAVVFDGRYLERAHPRTGMRYSAAGVFQFIRKTADRWIDGGYGNVTNDRLNIDAAARLYLHNRSTGLRGWEDWACAAVNDGFKQGGSVLPGWVGGPAELPSWAWELADAALA